MVERLGAAGIEVWVLSRSGRPRAIRGDLLTGEGLDVAVEGVVTIIHCAASPLRKARRVDVEGTKRLLDAAGGAGVSHFVYISIVGIDCVQSYPYYRAKLGTERVVEGSPVPHTILRATQFHGFWCADVPEPGLRPDPVGRFPAGGDPARVQAPGRGRHAAVSGAPHVRFSVGWIRSRLWFLSMVALFVDVSALIGSGEPYRHRATA